MTRGMLDHNAIACFKIFQLKPCAFISLPGLHALMFAFPIGKLIQRQWSTLCSMSTCGSTIWMDQFDGADPPPRATLGSLARKN